MASVAIECVSKVGKCGGASAASSARAMDGIAFDFDLARGTQFSRTDSFFSKYTKRRLTLHGIFPRLMEIGDARRRRRWRRHLKSEIMREKCLGKSCECPPVRARPLFTDSAKRPPRFSFGETRKCKCMKDKRFRNEQPLTIKAWIYHANHS